MTKLEFLEEIKMQIEHNLLCYSSNYYMDKPKEKYTSEWNKEKEKLEFVTDMINDEKTKEKYITTKNKKKYER